jgi:signal peptide peptidase SppA
MPKRLPHIATRVFGRPLMVARRELDALLKGLGPRLGIVNIPESDMYSDWDDDDDEDTPSEAAKPYTVTDDGIALISIAGSLVRKSSWLDSLCGMTSYAKLDSQFSLAIQDPEVRGILLDVDSPGGECAGVFDLADRMYNLRGTKPVYAVANEDMFSAAYALGSTADKIFLPRTGGVGSIGVICLHLDQSGYDQKEGLKYTAIFAGDRKNDFSPHEPLSDAALSTEQSEVDRLYGMFVDLVARNRGISAETVRRTEAGLFFGADGVTAGLADSVGTYADAYTALVAAVTPETREQLPPIFNNAGASAAANSNQREVTQVPDITPVADQNVPATSATGQTAPAASAPQVLQPVATPFYSDADIEEIDELCEMAGKGLREAKAFRAARLTPAQVRKELFKERQAAMSAQQINSAVAPGTSTEDEEREMATNPDKNPVVEAATRMGRGTKRPANSLAAAHCITRGIA